jgi:hypothetical protein
VRIAVVLAFLCARTAAADPATGEVEATLVAELDLASNHVARPTSLAPDVWWGVAPRWTIGLVHSGPSVDRIEAGASFCLGSSDPLVCDHVYRGSGLDARYALADWISPRMRVLVRDISPVKPAVTLGAQLRWHRGHVSITGDPYVQIGVANTDRGNDHAVVAPVQLAVDVCRWRGWLDTGWNSNLSVIRDGWHIPVGAGVQARVSPQLEIGGELGFPSLLGPQNTPKERVLFVFVTTRWQP